MKRCEYEAALALTELGVIRVRFDHPGYIGLHEKGLVNASPVDGDEDALDYRLSGNFKVRRAA